MKNTLLVLAAGIGSRYGGLKQIAPVGPNGEIILDYSVYDAIQAGFTKIVFVIRKDIEKDFRERIGKKVEKQIETEYAFQNLNQLPEGFICPTDRKKPWGTGHAILSAKDFINEPFAVVNADDFYGRSGYKQLSEHLRSPDNSDGKNLYFMVGYILRNTLSEHGYVSRGICNISKDSQLVEVVERTKIFREDGIIKYIDENNNEKGLSGEEIVSMNMWGFFPSIFESLEEKFYDFLKKNINDIKSEFFIPTVVSELIKAEKVAVKVLRSKDQWFGITYNEDKDMVVNRIKSLIDSGTYPARLF